MSIVYHLHLFFSPLSLIIYCFNSSTDSIRLSILYCRILQTKYVFRVRGDYKDYNPLKYRQRLPWKYWMHPKEIVSIRILSSEHISWPVCSVANYTRVLYMYHRISFYSSRYLYMLALHKYCIFYFSSGCNYPFGLCRYSTYICTCGRYMHCIWEFIYSETEMRRWTMFPIRLHNPGPQRGYAKYQCSIPL